MTGVGGTASSTTCLADYHLTRGPGLQLGSTLLRMVAPSLASSSPNQVSTDSIVVVCSSFVVVFTPAWCATNSNIVATNIRVGGHFIWVNVHSCVGVGEEVVVCDP